MTEYDHSAGLQFAPSQDHAHASMNNNDNLHADEAQEVYFGQGGQTYLQDLETTPPHIAPGPCNNFFLGSG